MESWFGFGHVHIGTGGVRGLLSPQGLAVTLQGNLGSIHAVGFWGGSGPHEGRPGSPAPQTPLLHRHCPNYLHWDHTLQDPHPMDPIWQLDLCLCKQMSFRSLVPPGTDNIHVGWGACQGSLGLLVAESTKFVYNRRQILVLGSQPSGTQICQIPPHPIHKQCEFCLLWDQGPLTQSPTA